MELRFRNWHLHSNKNCFLHLCKSSSPPPFDQKNIIYSRIMFNLQVREENQLQSWKPRGPNAQKCEMITEHFHNENKIEEQELVEKVLKG